MLIRLRHDEEGIAMVVSLMVAFVVMLLATVILGQAIHGSGRSAYGRNRLTAVSTAEAGLDYWYNYLQKTSPSSYTTSAIAGTVGSAPAVGTFTATPTFYTDSAGTAANTLIPPITSSNVPLSVKIKSTGTANAITRTMESFITLRPIYGGFQGALIANSGATFGGNFTVNGNSGNDADIFVLGTGAVFNVPSGLESIHGSIYVPAGSVGPPSGIGTQVHIYGQVWANGSVLVNHPGALIDGNISSTTSSVTVSSGAVAGNAYYCTGSAPSNVTGTKNSTCTLGPPPTQSFPQVTYVQSAWVSAGYTNFQTFSDCTAARNYVESTGAYAATGFSGHNVGNTVVRITPGCEYENSNNATITMNNNLAIITDGEINLSQQSNWNGVSPLKDLFMISTWPAATCPASGTAGSHNITFGNLTQTNNLVETFVYTPCTASMNNNNSSFTGQVIGTTLSIGNNFQENYKPIVVPGANLTGYNQDIAYIREVA